MSTEEESAELPAPDQASNKNGNPCSRQEYACVLQLRIINIDVKLNDDSRKRPTQTDSLPHVTRTHHTWNQSMVQQLTRDGFWRRRSRKALPIGLRHSTTCRRCLHCCTKKPHSSTGLSSPSLLAAGRTISSTCQQHTQLSSGHSSCHACA